MALTRNFDKKIVAISHENLPNSFDVIFYATRLVTTLGCEWPDS